jgi:hypothetical protein
MSDLRFVSDDELRQIIERDRRELNGCLANGLYKATILLAGSIIEAVLMDYFLVFPYQEKTAQQTLDANLASLINWSVETGLISPRTKELTTVVRHYRNLIHPGREYRVQEKVDIYTATVAANLVEIILQEISENYSKSLGYSAEQAIAKVKIDPTGTYIFADVIARMSQVERNKLFRTIPRLCLENKDTFPYSVVSAFILLHNMLKQKVQNDVLKREVEDVYDMIHHKSREDVMFHFRFFFDTLHIVDEKKRNTIVGYMLEVLTGAYGEFLMQLNNWGVYRMFGRYLNTESGRTLIVQTVIDRYFQDSEADISSDDDEFLSIIRTIYITLEDEVQKEIIGTIDEYGLGTRSKKWVDFLTEDDIPF